MTLELVLVICFITIAATFIPYAILGFIIENRKIALEEYKHDSAQNTRKYEIDRMYPEIVIDKETQKYIDEYNKEAKETEEAFTSLSEIATVVRTGDLDEYFTE